MERKTQATDADVAEFLATIPDERRRADSEAVCGLMAEATGRLADVDLDVLRELVGRSYEARTR